MLINVATFGLIGVPFGTALGFGAFVVIVLTVVQLVFRVMRVTLGERLGDSWVGFKNQHVSSVIGMVVTMGLVLRGLGSTCGSSSPEPAAGGVEPLP